MRIITKSPDLDDFEASASVDLGLTGSSPVRQRYNAMVNLPLMKDEIGLRVTGYYRNEDGWVDNIGTGVEDANTLQAFGGREIGRASWRERVGNYGKRQVDAVTIN